MMRAGWMCRRLTKAIFLAAVFLTAEVTLADCSIQCTYELPGRTIEVTYIVEGNVNCSGHLAEVYQWYFGGGQAAYCYDYYLFDCTQGWVDLGGGGWNVYL